jgi:hypothetical protein
VRRSPPASTRRPCPPAWLPQGNQGRFPRGGQGQQRQGEQEDHLAAVARVPVRSVADRPRPVEKPCFTLLWVERVNNARATGRPSPALEGSTAASRARPMSRRSHRGHGWKPRSRHPSCNPSQHDRVAKSRVSESLLTWGTTVARLAFDHTGPRGAMPTPPFVLARPEVEPRLADARQRVRSSIRRAPSARTSAAKSAPPPSTAK